MRHSQYHHTAAKVQDQALTLLMKNLKPKDYSKKCSALTVLTLLLCAAVHRISLTAAAVIAPKGTPGEETLRKALLAMLPASSRFQKDLPHFLADSLPKKLRKPGKRKTSYPMAIDLHSTPYFVRKRAAPKEARSGQKHKGTHHGFAYATAMILYKGYFYTLAMVCYLPGDKLDDVVKRLLRQARDNGFAPRYVLLDRGFWSVDVLRYLQSSRTPFLMPVIARGKKPDHPEGPTGTWKFFVGYKSGHSQYTLSNRKKEKVTVQIAVQRCRRPKPKKGRKKRSGKSAWVYAYWKMELKNLRWIREKYRRRFAIESSYRQMEECRARTSSRNASWRLLLMLLSVLLRNLWIQVHREVSGKRQGYLNRFLVVLGMCVADCLQTLANHHNQPPTTKQLTTTNAKGQK